MSDKKRIYLQPIPVRIWHWINAFGIITLIVSGAQIRFPESVTMLGSYKNAILIHNTAGLIVSISFSLWFFYYKMVKNTLDKLYLALRDLRPEIELDEAVRVRALKPVERMLALG